LICDCVVDARTSAIDVQHDERSQKICLSSENIIDETTMAAAMIDDAPIVLPKEVRVDVRH
jgi:hypothetical protein